MGLARHCGPRAGPLSPSGRGQTPETLETRPSTLRCPIDATMVWKKQLDSLNQLHRPGMGCLTQGNWQKSPSTCQKIRPPIGNSGPRTSIVTCPHMRPYSLACVQKKYPHYGGRHPTAIQGTSPQINLIRLLAIPCTTFSCIREDQYIFGTGSLLTRYFRLCHLCLRFASHKSSFVPAKPAAGCVGEIGYRGACKK